MLAHRLQKIVSGGQTGVDRAALDAAIYLEIDHGGWCPRGRRAEDGRIPEVYQLAEMQHRDYAKRTRQNVIDSDGTLILFRNRMSGGTELTYRLTKAHRRPCLTIDLEQIYGCDVGEMASTTKKESSAGDLVDPLLDTGRQQADSAAMDSARASVFQFLEQANIQVLNVAGPRESSAKGIGQQAEQFLVSVFQPPESVSG